MARKFGTSVDYQKGQLINAVAHNLGAAPSSPVKGQLYYDTSSEDLMAYTGATPGWKSLTGGGASAYTGTGAVVKATLPTFVGSGGVSINAGNARIMNVADPTAGQDAASKAYVDAIASGLKVKGTVRAATAAALPAYARVGDVITASANGVLTVDGVTFLTGDRVLVKNGASSVDNGLYVVTNPGTVGAPFVLTRSTDGDSSTPVNELSAGTHVWVAEGTVNADTGWVITTNDPITINATPIVWGQFASVIPLSAITMSAAGGIVRPSTRRLSYLSASGASTMAGVGDVASTNGTAGTVLPTAAGPWVRTSFTSAAVNTNTGFAAGQPNHLWGAKPSSEITVSPGAVIAASRIYVGLATAIWATVMGADTPGSTFAVSGALFRYSTNAGDTNWKCLTCDGTSQTVVDSGVSVVASIGKLFEISDNGTATIFKINGVQVASITTTRPASTAVVRQGAGVMTLEAVAKTIDIGWLYTQTETA